MRFMWSTARKDWIRRWRDPVALLLWIGIPVFIGGILTAPSIGVMHISWGTGFLIGQIDGPQTEPDVS